MIKNFLVTKAIFCLLSTMMLFSIVEAQPFIEEITAFKKQDSIGMPPRNAILFVGSSSFRMWTSMQQDLSTHTVINRGFGGSSLTDVIRYADQIIFPYQPGQVVIYCGENDLASSDSITAQTVNERFQKLFNLIRKKYPGIPIAFVSIKPSPSRQHLLPKIIAANDLIKNFLNTQPKTAYIDVFNAMLDPQGKPKPDLFIDDRLHMNKRGYAIWIEVIGPFLIKN
jgi:lysophospholipase L1-like esterase